VDKPNANNKKLENALDYSIKLLNSGATIEDCLKLYPNQRRELRSLLESATALKTAYPGHPELRPSKLYAKTARAEFLSAIENGVPASKPRVRESETTKSNLFVFNSFYRRIAMVSTAAAAALVIVAGGLVYASGDSMPGTPLYAAKRTAEKIQLAFALNPEGKAKLHYNFAQRRIDEAKHMAKAGKDGQVAGISKEAKKSLDEASKVAKVVPPVEKDKIASEIESLDKAVSERLAKNVTPTDNAGAQEASNAAALTEKSKVNVGEDQSATSTASPAMSAASKKSAEKPASDVSSGKALASLAAFEVGGIIVSDKYISPNGDGIKDAISISVQGSSADRFKVELYKGALPVAVLAEQKAGNDLEFTWDGRDIDGSTMADGEYFIRVSNSIGQTARSRAKVVVDTGAPLIKLIEPPANVETVVLRPRFVWADGEDIESYTLYLTLDGATKEIAGITDNFYLVETDLRPGTWKWIVVARDKAGNMGRSEARALIITETKDDGASKE